MTEETNSAEPTENNASEQTSEDVDALYDSIMNPDVEPEAPTEGEAKSDDKPVEETGVNEQPAEDGSALDKFILKHKEFENGEREFSRDKVTEYAQKGFDYELKMHQLKQERQQYQEELEALESQRTEFEEKREYWEKIDQYMEENPTFAETVKQAWEQQQGNAYSSATMSPEFQALQSTIQDLRERLDAKDNESRARSQKTAEESLIKSKASYREKHSDFDWESKDELGMSLQDRIEEHAVENGIKKFELAANSYLFDQHLKRAELSAKEKAGKELMEKRKQGLGPITDHSTKGRISSGGISQMSYNDLASEALRELGLAD
jgi:hypothetical protein